MQKCPYCHSVVKKVSEIIFYCSFCDMNVSQNKPVEGQFIGAVDHVDAAKPTKVLKTYHTFDLLLLLRFCREERRATYDLMQTFNRVKSLSPEFAAGFKDAYNQYDYWTKKARVAEGLVKERIGFIPKAVTKKLLETFLVMYQDSRTVPGQKYA